MSAPPCLHSVPTVTSAARRRRRRRRINRIFPRRTRRRAGGAYNSRSDNREMDYARINICRFFPSGPQMVFPCTSRPPPPSSFPAARPTRRIEHRRAGRQTNNNSPATFNRPGSARGGRCNCEGRARRRIARRLSRPLGPYFYTLRYYRPFVGFI